MISDLDETPMDFGGAVWQVLKGDCSIDADECITSPGYPGNYSASQVGRSSHGFSMAFKGFSMGFKCFFKGCSMVFCMISLAFF